MTAGAVATGVQVVERKRELEATKEKMDRLLEKLYIGRERGIELSGAIASNQRMMSFMPGRWGGLGRGGCRGLGRACLDWLAAWGVCAPNPLPEQPQHPQRDEAGGPLQQAEAHPGHLFAGISARHA